MLLGGVEGWGEAWEGVVCRSGWGEKLWGVVKWEEIGGFLLCGLLICDDAYW